MDGDGNDDGIPGINQVERSRERGGDEQVDSCDRSLFFKYPSDERESKRQSVTGGMKSLFDTREELNQKLRGTVFMNDGVD